MLKNLLTIFWLIVFLGVMNTAMAKPSKTYLVLDMRNRAELPRGFRTTSDPIPNDINAKGFKALHIAGSGQFSKLGLRKALNMLGGAKVKVLDLRQESHGYLNGNAISWYGYRNADNSNLSPEEIETRQANLLARIGQEKEITVFKIDHKTDDEVIDKVSPIDFAVHQVLSEPELLQEFKTEYQRLYVQDFHAPDWREVDTFINLVKNRKKNEWLYIHCRAGRGRTTLFMTLHDMLWNAKQVSFDDILKRNFAIGGKDLSELPNPDVYKYQFSVKRYEFLKMFYQYAKLNKDNFETSWSSWLAEVSRKKK